MFELNTSPDDNPLAQRLKALPIFAQLLVACRFVQRSAMTMLEGVDQVKALSACSVVETICRLGHEQKCETQSLIAISRIHETNDNRSCLKALSLLVQSVNAYDSLNSAQATSYAVQIIDAIWADPRIAKMQVAILINSDIEQIETVCIEAGISAYNALSDYVLGRITACHELTLLEPRRSLEDEYR